MFDSLGLTAVFFGGMLSFLSPCVLPLVPFYMTYLAGSNSKVDEISRIMVMRQAVSFVLGLGLVFVLLGATASFAGQFLGSYKHILARISGFIILLFGLHFLGIMRIPLLYRQTQFTAVSTRPSSGAFIMGITFAFGWTPCIGPVLGSILLYAAQEQTVWHGTRLLSLYAIGLGTPFLLAAFFITSFNKFLHKAKPWMPWVERITGGALVIMGILLMFNIFEKLAYNLLEVAPWMATLG